MRPEVNLAKRLSKIFCLRLVSWEQRIMMKTQSGLLKSYLWKLALFFCSLPGFCWALVISNFSARHKLRLLCGVLGNCPFGTRHALTRQYCFCISCLALLLHDKSWISAWMFVQWGLSTLFSLHPSQQLPCIQLILPGTCHPAGNCL